jgi:hypothetical protein
MMAPFNLRFSSVFQAMGAMAILFWVAMMSLGLLSNEVGPFFGNGWVFISVYGFVFSMYFLLSGALLALVYQGLRRSLTGKFSRNVLENLLGCVMISFAIFLADRASVDLWGQLEAELHPSGMLQLPAYVMAQYLGGILGGISSFPGYWFVLGSFVAITIRFCGEYFLRRRRTHLQISA